MVRICSKLNHRTEKRKFQVENRKIPKLDANSGWILLGQEGGQDLLAGPAPGSPIVAETALPLDMFEKNRSHRWMVLMDPNVGFHQGLAALIQGQIEQYLKQHDVVMSKNMMKSVVAFWNNECLTMQLGYSLNHNTLVSKHWYPGA